MLLLGFQPCFVINGGWVSLVQCMRLPEPITWRGPLLSAWGFPKRWAVSPLHCFFIPKALGIPSALICIMSCAVYDSGRPTILRLFLRNLFSRSSILLSTTCIFESSLSIYTWCSCASSSAVEILCFISPILAVCVRISALSCSSLGLGRIVGLLSVVSPCFFGLSWRRNK